MKLSEIRIRDPFVLPVAAEGAYYLYGTTDENVWKGKAEGFLTYKSIDLINWEGPFQAFKPEKDFWADRQFWAPEVHEYKGAYYMFASFKAENCYRGTQILKADSPTGPFLPYTKGPITPTDMECLDGTLYVEDGTPWIVFSHEWTEAKDGKIYAMKLTSDLKKAAGEPILLFSASSSGWAQNVTDGIEEPPIRYVTDGPFLFWEEGSLKMMWSSFYNDNYAMGIAYSENGRVDGKWKHEKEPFFTKDGGHGMLFKTFEGKQMLAIHSPNKSPMERAVFIEMEHLR
ncbi:glycoside hydrolase family 43 protein [Konateibacter massiliensis]|uniref:glycoside hydrolase family 43 protein n=1 Tax=Konateibacter massiliensis TaxID=2002841 RepID=UPI000C1593DA|nr:glycoside hydrolase family 43 protein [Konateibacter massiliensis]